MRLFFFLIDLRFFFLL